MIAWKQVSVSFGNRRVLGPVNVDVADGEWLGLIGPNGAGKSTMLKAGIDVVSYDGDIDLGGRRGRAGLDIAWMPQRPRLPDEMSVANYVLLGRTPHLGYLGSETQHDLDSVGRALERLQLAEMSDRALATLSGGEAQRAVLARALAQEAPVLLLDEPTSSLDIGHGLEVLELIDELRGQEGLTVVTAVHDLTLAGRFADRLVLLDHGMVVADGSPSAVLREDVLVSSYGPALRVVDDGDGPTVIPTRRQSG